VARERLEEIEDEEDGEAVRPSSEREALWRALLDGALASPWPPLSPGDGCGNSAAAAAADAAERFEARAARLLGGGLASSSSASAASAAESAGRAAAEAAASLWRRAGRPERALRLALALPPRAGLALLAEGLAHKVARELMLEAARKWRRDRLAAQAAGAAAEAAAGVGGPGGQGGGGGGEMKREARARQQQQPITSIFDSHIPSNTHTLVCVFGTVRINYR
jgi:hypothetical protein